MPHKKTNLIYLYNTLSRKKEPFVHNKDKAVTIYTCGPTVYKPAHIGHMVGPIIFDTLKRYLVHLGYQVKWVLNITDIDDKIIETAKEQNKSTKQLTEEMLTDYQQALNSVNVKGINAMPVVTDYIKPIINMIHTLVDRGRAFRLDGSVYFNTAKFTEYGKLSNCSKETIENFALWKAAKYDEPNEVQFESPFGCGRPGWHIECSCMLKECIGDTADIHGGGLDLQFPHHENEIAQSETFTNRPLAKIWMHHGLVKVGTAKMSGSIGNYIRVSDLVKKYSGDIIRLFVLSTHYRSPFDIGIIKNEIPSAIATTAISYSTFTRLAERIKSITNKDWNEVETVPPSADFEDIRQRFFEHLADDFNTAGAVSIAFELCNRLNHLADKYKLNTVTAEGIGEFKQGVHVFKLMMNLLGLTLQPPSAEKSLDHDLIKLLLAVRTNLKLEAQSQSTDSKIKPVLYQQADLIRARLHELGVTIEDTPQGSQWRTTCSSQK